VRVEHKLIAYSFGDRFAKVEFTDTGCGAKVRVALDSETTYSLEQQAGWQAILDKFSRHVEAKRQQGSACSCFAGPVGYTLICACANSALIQSQTGRSIFGSPLSAIAEKCRTLSVYSTFADARLAAARCK
jgi:hypothetical protein